MPTITTNSSLASVTGQVVNVVQTFCTAVASTFTYSDLAPATWTSNTINASGWIPYTSTAWLTWQPCGHGVDDGTGNAYAAGDDNSTLAPATWITWVGELARVVTPTPTPSAVLTAEQRAAAERVAEAARAQRAQHTAAQLAADHKAEVLLKSCLTKAQQVMLEERDYFYVEVSGRKYRIDRGFAGNVKLVRNEDEQPLESFCIHPATRTPAGDAMLAQKLLLETDEDRFLRTANRTALHAPPLRRAGPEQAEARAA